MIPIKGSIWSLLFQRLRHSNDFSIDIDVLNERGLVVDDAVQSGLFERHGDSALATDARRIFESLRRRNCLEALDVRLPKDVVPVGVYRCAEGSIPVVWTLNAPIGFSIVCLGVRTSLCAPGIIALTNKVGSTRWDPAHRVAILELPEDDTGDLGLSRGLDLLYPERQRKGDDWYDIGRVDLVFATDPRHGHVLKINGHAGGWFATSDVGFTRMLVMAAALKTKRREGWVRRERLMNGTKRELESLRDELASRGHRELNERQLRRMIEGKFGHVRLGVLPERVTFDPSLAAFSWAYPELTRITTMTEAEAKQVIARLDKARWLLGYARMLGAPGSEHDFPAMPALCR